MYSLNIIDRCCSTGSISQSSNTSTALWCSNGSISQWGIAVNQLVWCPWSSAVFLVYLNMSVNEPNHFLKVRNAHLRENVSTVMHPFQCYIDLFNYYMDHIIGDNKRIKLKIKVSETPIKWSVHLSTYRQWFGDSNAYRAIASGLQNMHSIIQAGALQVSVIDKHESVTG